MIIDSKGRIFGRINLVDITIIVILILACFIAIKFIFFMPDYIHYENATIQVDFTDVPITSLYQLKTGKNYFYMDNYSYLPIYGGEYARCNSEKNGVSLVYYFNGTELISASTLLADCYHNSKQQGKVYLFYKPSLNFTGMAQFECKCSITKYNHSVNCSTIYYYFNDSYLEFPEKYFFGCYYDNNGIDLDYYFDNPMLQSPEIKTTHCTYESVNDTFIYLKDIDLNFNDSICDISLLFKIKARILDDRPFYNYDYQLFKRGYFGFRIGDITIRGGKIVSVQENV